MTRKVLSLVLLGATFALSFALVSFARSSNSGVSFPSLIPASTQPAAALTNDAKVALGDTIGSYQATREGINATSFDQVRELGVHGTLMYVVPGTVGICLVFGGGSACSDYGSAGQILGPYHMLALYVSDPLTGAMTGGGITDGSGNGLVLSQDGKDFNVPITDGTFVVEPGLGLRPPPSGPVVPSLVNPTLPSVR